MQCFLYFLSKITLFSQGLITSIESFISLFDIVCPEPYRFEESDPCLSLIKLYPVYKRVFGMLSLF